ncbi:MAG: response regulator [Alphaproteobacteria bacterium]|nr:MAG: response regulator [Alphaproteobacteria bacterium]
MHDGVRPANSQAAAAAARLHGMRALVAFSNPMLRDIVYHFLHGLRLAGLHSANDSLDAFKLIERVGYDLCFVDYDIQDMGGPTLTRFIRTCDNATASSHVFVVIADPDRKKAHACRGAGADTILGLPLTRSLLIDRMRRVLANPGRPGGRAPRQADTGPVILYRGVSDPGLDILPARPVVAVAY